MSPLLILLIAIVAVVGMILVLRLSAFIALISTAILISLLAPGPFEDKIARVAVEFGKVAGSIGIVIALAAIIGKCMLDSGAADRIVRSFLRVLGEKRAPWALMGSGFVLSIPVFFDTVFYLLVPLARSLCRRTGKDYILYLSAIVAGAAVTHNLVPPTPGPLFAANGLNIDLGMMIIMGILIGLPSSIAGLIVCYRINRFLNIPMRPYSDKPEPEPLDDEQLPPLLISLLPVLLPVILISTHTASKAIPSLHNAARITAVLGNPNLALLISAVIAMYLVAWKRNLRLRQLGDLVDSALMSGGIIILITAGGGALGAMLRVAGIQDSIASFVGSGEHKVGMIILAAGFASASLIKFAQGSSTVSTITATSMFAAMGITPDMLSCHPVYLAMAICSGSQVGDWMNDSGFWVFARMGVLSETESLKSFTIVIGTTGVAGFVVTLILATVMPLV
jgi:gluconate:H+ symporter, GntP family